MRNWRTIAVFLGPRQTTAEEREGRRKPRDMRWREPTGMVVPSFPRGVGGEVVGAPLVFAEVLVVVTPLADSVA